MHNREQCLTGGMSDRLYTVDLKALNCEELLGPSSIVFTLCACRKLSDGLFLRQCSEVAELYPNIEFNSMIIDNCCMQVSGGGGGGGGGGRWKQGLGRRAREGG